MAAALFGGGKKAEFPKDTIYNVIKDLSPSRLDNYAIDYYGNELTYRQFLSEVDLAASALESLGVKCGDIIACNSATIPEMIVLLYASNKIGATMLAIDPRRTPSFIKEMVEESKAKLFFTIDVSYPLTKAIIPELDVVKTIIISPDNYLPFMLKTLKKIKDKKIDIAYSDSVINWKSFLALGKGKSSSTAKYGDNDVVAITFTGGTIGEPKGVMLTNDGSVGRAIGVLDTLDEALEELPVTIDDKSGIKLLYTNAVITAKIDNRTNKIVSAKWSYDVIITVDNTKIKAFGIPITLDGTEVVIRFEATL